MKGLAALALGLLAATPVSSLCQGPTTSGHVVTTDGAPLL